MWVQWVIVGVYVGECGWSGRVKYVGVVGEVCGWVLVKWEGKLCGSCCWSVNYLLYSSEHPRYLLNGIPYSQFMRVKRLCSKDKDFRLNALLRRGYPKHLVLKALERTKLLKHETLLNKETLKETLPEPQNKKFYCVTTHNPLNPPIRDTVTDNWDILGKTKTSRQLLDTEIIFGLWRNKNLSDHLVRASTSTKNDENRPKWINSCHATDYRLADTALNLTRVAPLFQKGTIWHIDLKLM